MFQITATELRTKIPEIFELLARGETVEVYRRSRPVAEIRPKQVKTKKFNAKEFEKIVKKLNLPYLSDKEIEKRYRQAMVKKHGQYLL